MSQKNKLKLLFIINSSSGNNSTDWETVVKDHSTTSSHIIEIQHLTKACTIQTIKDKINLFKPQQVIAVGGDGTVKFAAECLIGQKIALGILPAGSANGLARELGIPNEHEKALDVLFQGNTKKIHAIRINGHLCIHLSDIGLNAYAMKIFESQRVRGMWGYFVAAIKVLWQNPVMEMKIETPKEIVHLQAEMVVIANATKYGNGALINPIGQMDDKLFEVIAIKKISILAMLKVVFLNATYDPEKTEILQTNALSMKSAKKVHFQVDGEYLGKVKEVHAVIIPDALEVIVPASNEVLTDIIENT